MSLSIFVTSIESLKMLRPKKLREMQGPWEPYSPEGRYSMATQNFLQEMQSMGQKLLLKLRQLPQAEPVEIVAFSVILFFIATVLLLLAIACSCCCTQCCCPDQRSRKIQVQPMTPS